jgi:hypothetical protein
VRGFLIHKRISHSAKCSCDDAGCEEEIQTPLQLIAFIVHADEIKAA